MALENNQNLVVQNSLLSSTQMNKEKSLIMRKQLESGEQQLKICLASYFLSGLELLGFGAYKEKAILCDCKDLDNGTLLRIWVILKASCLGFCLLFSFYIPLVLLLASKSLLAVTVPQLPFTALNSVPHSSKTHN